MRQDVLDGYMAKHTVPETVAEDDDDVVVALETARVSEERNDLEAAQKWLHRAAAAARRQGRPDRAGILSRCAARVVGESSQFEKRPDEEQVLGDALDDEFADNTIVETAEEIARKAAPDPTVLGQTTLRSPPPDSKLEASDEELSFDFRAGRRVAVTKKEKGTGYSARILASDEMPQAGEQEALLVPRRGQVQFS